MYPFSTLCQHYHQHDYSSLRKPNPSVNHRRARWNTRDVNWQGFADAVDTAIAAYPFDRVWKEDLLLRAVDKGLPLTCVTSSQTDSLGYKLMENKVGRYR